MKLNLGAGDDRKEGFIGVDIRKARATDIQADVRALPIASEAAEAVLCYDIIEHLQRNEVAPFLEEVHRVMCSGGELFLKTPDMHTLVLEYLWKGMPAAELERKLYGGQEYLENTHKTGFTESLLREKLIRAGFKNIMIQTGIGFDWSNLIAKAVKP